LLDFGKIQKEVKSGISSKHTREAILDEERSQGVDVQFLVVVLVARGDRVRRRGAERVVVGDVWK